MFTGLVEEKGEVCGIKKEGAGFVLKIKCDKILEDITQGDSIAIDGVCQTVTTFDSSTFSVFFSSITASLTTLKKLKSGDRVNLERAMTLNRRFGGHIVQGHVDGIGKIIEINKDSSGIEFRIITNAHLLKYIVKKGSITVNGISLTVVDCLEDFFTLYIIPETIGVTSIEFWKVGDEVNIEVDILAKYIEKIMRINNESNDNLKDENLKSLLSKNGFML